MRAPYSPFCLSIHKLIPFAPLCGYCPFLFSLISFFFLSTMTHGTSIFPSGRRDQALGLFPPWDVSLVSSRALHGWGCPPSFVGLCFCFVQFTALLYAFGRCLFCGKAAFYVSFGYSFAPLPLLVAFTPGCFYFILAGTGRRDPTTHTHSHSPL